MNTSWFCGNRKSCRDRHLPMDRTDSELIGLSSSSDDDFDTEVRRIMSSSSSATVEWKTVADSAWNEQPGIRFNTLKLGTSPYPP